MKIPGWFWIVFAAVILIGGVLAGGVMLLVSWNHPSLEVDDDYYQLAVSYDEQKAQKEVNRLLGWEPELYLERKNAAGIRETLVRLSVLDRTGRPLEGAEVLVEAFHLARTGERFGELLPEVSPGVYAALMPLRRIGIWEFRLVIHHDGHTYIAVLEQEF